VSAPRRSSYVQAEEGNIEIQIRMFAPQHGIPEARKTLRTALEIPTGERGVRRDLLHLLRDFSQSAILRYMSGNSADISKGYFDEPIGSSNPLWSASKSLILRRKIYVAELSRDFRGLAVEVAQVGH